MLGGGGGGGGGEGGGGGKGGGVIAVVVSQSGTRGKRPYRRLSHPVNSLPLTYERKS